MDKDLAEILFGGGFLVTFFFLQNIWCFSFFFIITLVIILAALSVRQCMFWSHGFKYQYLNM